MSLQTEQGWVWRGCTYAHCSPQTAELTYGGSTSGPSPVVPAGSYQPSPEGLSSGVGGTTDAGATIYVPGALGKAHGLSVFQCNKNNSQ